MTTEQQNKILGRIAIALVIGGIVLYLLRVPLTAISINCFLFTDSLVKLSSSFNPIVMWVILGLFIGVIYGSFVAWMKYRLEFKLNLISIGIFVLFFVFLFLLNKPIQSNATNTFVFKPNVEVEKPPVTHYYYKISTSKAYLYSTASTQSSVLSKAGYKDIEVEVLEFTNDNWCLVKLYNTTGYIKRKSIVFSRTDPPMQQPENVSAPQNSTQTSDSNIRPDTASNNITDSSTIIENEWKVFWNEFTNAVSSKDKSKIAELASTNFSDNASTTYGINDWLTVFDNEERYNRLLDKIKKGVTIPQNSTGNSAKYLGDEAGDETFYYINGRWYFTGVLGD